MLFGVQKELLKKENYKDSELLGFNWSKKTLYSIEDIKNKDWPSVSPFEENSYLEKPTDIFEQLTVEYWFNKNDVQNHPNGNDFFQPKAGIVKMREIEEGDVSKKCYKRLHRWRYSPTAAYGNNEVHLHPYKIRRLSVAETLAIQSLPKDFVLPAEMTLTDKFKTVGNGVPYLAAKGIAETIKEYLEIL